MNEEILAELKDYYLSQNKPNKLDTLEQFFQIKHELRMSARERECIKNSQTNPI